MTDTLFLEQLGVIASTNNENFFSFDNLNLKNNELILHPMNEINTLSRAKNELKKRFSKAKEEIDTILRFIEDADYCELLDFLDEDKKTLKKITSLITFKEDEVVEIQFNLITDWQKINKF